MKYTVWITITINHAFYHSKKTGLELQETDATTRLLKNSGVLFRKQAPNQWVVLKPEIAEGKADRLGLRLKEAAAILEFELVIPSPEFHYVTHWEKEQAEGHEWSIGPSTKNGANKKYLRIKLEPGAANETKNIALMLHSREVRWELILIPKYNNTAYPIELKEAQDRLLFSIPELISFPGEQKAYRSLSTSLITMKESYPYKISLWEKRENGKRLLSHHLPFPRVDSASIMNPREMITSYFYF